MATAIAAYVPEPGSIADMRQDLLRLPFSADVKCDKDACVSVETDMDGMVMLYVNKPGCHMGLWLTAQQAGELEQALYRAREHVGAA